LLPPRAPAAIATDNDTRARVFEILNAHAAPLDAYSIARAAGTVSTCSIVVAMLVTAGLGRCVPWAGSSYSTLDEVNKGLLKRGSSGTTISMRIAGHIGPEQNTVRTCIQRAALPLSYLRSGRHRDWHATNDLPGPSGSNDCQSCSPRRHIHEKEGGIQAWDRHFRL